MRIKTKKFNVIRLSRKDIIQLFEDESDGSVRDEFILRRVMDNINALSNEDMVFLADKMSDGITDCCFWHRLKYLIKEYLTEKLEIGILLEKECEKNGL